MAAVGACTTVPHGFAVETEKAALPVPTDAQKRWADMELGMFFHFDKIEASRLRLSVSKSAATPLIRDFSAYCN